MSSDTRAKCPLRGGVFEKAGRGARPWALSAKNTKRLRKRDRAGETGLVAPTSRLPPCSNGATQAPYPRLNLSFRA